jgi:hypothetical protein
VHKPFSVSHNVGSASVVDSERESRVCIDVGRW